MEETETSSRRRAALVTGASSGIGQAAAVALARAGFDVMINYSSNQQGARDTVSQVEAAGARADLARVAHDKDLLGCTAK